VLIIILTGDNVEGGGQKTDYWDPLFSHELSVSLVISCGLFYGANSISDYKALNCRMTGKLRNGKDFEGRCCGLI
jgi:hypothetical protein